PVTDSLKNALRAKVLLLILDNFEQVAAAAPSLVDLLHAAPGVQVLVTSRTALCVSGEHEFSVPPLTLPDLSQQPALATLSQCPSVQLFVQRAQAVKPEFSLTGANAPAVAAI